MVNWNLLKCALFNRHKLDNGVRLDEVRIERHCIYCRYEVIVNYSKVDMMRGDVIRYFKEGSYAHAKMSFDMLMEELGYKWK